MPLDGERLIIEPNYPQAAELMAIGAAAAKSEDFHAEDERLGLRLRNRFWSAHKRADVLVIEDADGRISYGLEHHIHSFTQQLRTLGCCDAWGIEQEARAIQKLGELTTHRQFKQYMLTGSFIETSPRSRVAYVFRRLRPTVALTFRDHKGRPGPFILAALCLHPIGYYDGSWAGAMCPTDDVIAHLMLMRGDEKMFWRRSNQHSALRTEAGL